MENFGHKFRNNLIEEEYSIKAKSDYSGNPQIKYIIERIHQVFGNLEHTYNLHETYIDDSNQWMGILAETNIFVWYMYDRIKENSTGQLVFSRYMILPINQVADWKYICYHKQAQI